MIEIYQHILQKKSNDEKVFSLLIDPDKHTDRSLKETIVLAEKVNVDFIFIGGSIVSNYLDEYIQKIKKQTNIPVVIFPGSLMQISNSADAILLLSLISGRNPEYLIGNHVVAAPFLKRSNLEIISTGYILIEGNATTSVEYMSFTKPIPRNKSDIVTATALAGEMLGLKMIYLEGGSGTENPISDEIIQRVHQNISIPLIVGGGIRTIDQLISVYQSGADMVVVGTAIEKSLSLLDELASVPKRMRVK